MTTYNNGKTLEVALREAYKELYDVDKVWIWNEYCEQNNLWDDQIFELCDDNLDEKLSCMTPSNAIYAFRYARRDDRYFTYNGDTVTTFDNPDHVIWKDDLIEWLERWWEVWARRDVLEIWEDDEEDEE